jgi:hypothetical protein
MGRTHFPSSLDDDDDDDDNDAAAGRTPCQSAVMHTAFLGLVTTGVPSERATTKRGRFFGGLGRAVLSSLFLSRWYSVSWSVTSRIAHFRSGSNSAHIHLAAQGMRAATTKKKKEKSGGRTSGFPFSNVIHTTHRQRSCYLSSLACSRQQARAFSFLIMSRCCQRYARCFVHDEEDDHRNGKALARVAVFSFRGLLRRDNLMDHVVQLMSARGSIVRKNHDGDQRQRRGGAVLRRFSRGGVPRPR